MEKFDLGKFLADSGVNIDTGNRKQIEDIPIDRIDPDPNNFYHLSGLEDLTSNIALMGLQQPILVRPSGDRYIIISGHRRHAALQKLIAEDGREDLRQVPCIVDRAQDSPEFTQLKLIYANASTRTVTSAEQSAQTEQVEKLLYQLKEQGMEFPGRMRDYVAQICKISTGKLARLKVIREHLIPEFSKLWQQGKLTEGAAYVLAGHGSTQQKMVWIAQTKDGTQDGCFYEHIVKNCLEEMRRVKQLGKTITCPNGGDCSHTYTLMEKAAGLGGYQRLACTGCCKQCSSLATCKYSCELACAEREEQRKANREKSRQMKEAAEQAEAPERELLSVWYRRAGELRKSRGVTEEQLLRTDRCYCLGGDLERYKKLEAGSTPNISRDRMPGGIWASEAKRMIATADLLGCSIDYLLGRTDCKEVNHGNAECVKIDTGWRTGDPANPGLYYVLYNDDDYPDEQFQMTKAEWTGDSWKAYGESLKSVGMTAVYWISLPEG